jgi:hypothetical protein
MHVKYTPELLDDALKRDNAVLVFIMVYYQKDHE